MDARKFAQYDIENIEDGLIQPEGRTLLDTYIIESVSKVQLIDFADYERYIKSLNL